MLPTSHSSCAKKLLAFLIPVALVPFFACSLSGWWVTEGNFFWQPIDYFPLPVNEILLLEPYGNEFWVTTSDNEIHRIEYPCENEQDCWNIADDLPEFDLSYVEYKISENSCENDSIAYDLPQEVDICITSRDYVESPRIVSLALTEDHKLWIWQKPSNSPYNVIAIMYISTFVGAITGVLIGTILVYKIE